MRRTLGLLAGLAVLASLACTDSVSPKSHPSPADGSNPVVLGLSGGPTFTITPQAGSTMAAGYTLTWSDNAIDCVGDPCEPWTGGPLTISVRSMAANGSYWVDFSPHVEFRSSAVVTLSTTAYGPAIRKMIRNGVATSDPIWQIFNIKYASTLGDLGVVDLPTTIDFTTGTISRRVQHFSGYVITSGFTCDPAVEQCDGTPPTGQ